MSNKSLYRVRFTNQGEIYEVYATYVGQSELFGFLEIEELVFGESTAVVVDPSEERLKTEFEGVKCSYIPMHTIIRIDEVEKKGISKITELKATKSGSNISQFPSPIYTPTKKE